MASVVTTTAITAAAVSGAGVAWGARTTRVVAGPTSRWIVRVKGSPRPVESAVVRLGGRVSARVALIDGLIVDLPASAVNPLRGTAGVMSLTPDAHLKAQAAVWDPVGDIGSPNVLSQVTGAQAYWAAGFTGKGVDVSLIDSGVAVSDGLPAGKVIYGPDLSWDTNNPALRNIDNFGHGTHMAGIIAGHTSDASTQNPSQGFLGMAPDSRIVSVKVADGSGATLARHQTLRLKAHKLAHRLAAGALGD